MCSEEHSYKHDEREAREEWNKEATNLRHYCALDWVLCYFILMSIYQIHMKSSFKLENIREPAVPADSSLIYLRSNSLALTTAFLSFSSS